MSFDIESMLRIHLLLQWFNFSDPPKEEAMHDTPVLTSFATLDAGTTNRPDVSTTILRFRLLLQRHGLELQIN